MSISLATTRIRARKPAVGKALADHEFLGCVDRTPATETWESRSPDGRGWLVKVLFNALDATPARQNVLRRLQELQHPNLPETQVLTGGPGCLVVATHAPGISLHEQLTGAKASGAAGLPRVDVLRWLSTVAHALDAIAAKHGVSHLSLAPKNLIADDKDVRILDYGLTPLIWLPTTQLIGQVNPRYAAPELFDRQRAASSSDIFSLAVIYQELLTGKTPFAVRPTGVPNLSPLSESDRTVIARALTFDPTRRFPNAVALVEALKSADVVQASVSAPPPPMPKIEAAPPVNEPLPFAPSRRESDSIHDFDPQMPALPEEEESVHPNQLREIAEAAAAPCSQPVVQPAPDLNQEVVVAEKAERRRASEESTRDEPEAVAVSEVRISISDEGPAESCPAATLQAVAPEERAPQEDPTPSDEEDAKAPTIPLEVAAPSPFDDIAPVHPGPFALSRLLEQQPVAPAASTGSSATPEWPFGEVPADAPPMDELPFTPIVATTPEETPPPAEELPAPPPSPFDANFSPASVQEATEPAWPPVASTGLAPTPVEIAVGSADKTFSFKAPPASSEAPAPEPVLASAPALAPAYQSYTIPLSTARLLEENQAAKPAPPEPAKPVFRPLRSLRKESEARPSKSSRSKQSVVHKVENLEALLAAAARAVPPNEPERWLQTAGEGEVLECRFPASLPPNGPPIQFERFREKWNAQQVRLDDESALFEIGPQKKFWKRLLGRTTPLLAEVRWSRPRPPAIGIPGVVMRVWQANKNDKNGLTTLREMGPALIENLRTQLQGGSERRKEKRILWVQPVTATFLLSNGEQSGSVEGQSRDLSGSGMGLYLQRILPGTQVQLQLSDPAADPVTVVGKFIRVQRCGDGWYEVGVRFEG